MVELWRRLNAASNDAGRPSTRFGGDRQTLYVYPPGDILYTAEWWPEVVEYALTFAEERSPVRSGRYKASWFAMVNNAVPSSPDWTKIPQGATVTITNDQPYSKKIELGRQHVNVPPGIVEDLVTALRRRFGDVLAARRQFISLTINRQTGVYRAYRARGRRRRARAGRALVYPAAILQLRAT